MHFVSKLLIIIHIIHLNIKMHCNQEPAMILNHVEGSSNQVEVTGKIYVILESGIKLPLLFL